MSCGTPVLAARTSSLPEIVGPGGILVNPAELDEVVEEMAALVQSPSLRGRLAQDALEQAAEFDWIQTANETLQVYELAVSGAGAHPALDSEAGGHFD